MKMRNGLAALTAGFLSMCVSGGVFAKTPQTMPINPFRGPGAMRGPLAARNQRMMELLAQKKAAATQNRVVLDATGSGPAPRSAEKVLYAFDNCHAALNEENAESLLSIGSLFVVIFFLYEKRRIL